VYTIGIDATLVRGDRITGIERTIIELLKQFDKFQNQKYKMEVFCHPGSKKMFKGISSNDNLIMNYSPFKNRILTEQIWLPWISKKKNLDLMFFTTLGPSLLYKGNFIVHVHDAIPWLYPDTLSKGMKYYYRPLLEKAIQSSKLTKITTVSNHSKGDLQKLFNIPEDKIAVVYGGVSENFSSSFVDKNHDDRLLKKYGVSGEYIISIATLEPRKNIGKLIQAFSDMKKSNSSFSNLKLVLVGRKGWETNFVIDEEIKKDIILTGFVDDNDLPNLLASAELFVLPSLYEGFGLPLLEAMNCGVACVVSNTSSLPEVGGDAAIYFDPNDTQDVIRKITDVLSNTTLKESMIIRGHSRVKSFSWENTAKGITDTFEEFIKRVEQNEKSKNM
jgi:glycosyltransferase involved in cell wall biosynthesis